MKRKRTKVVKRIRTLLAIPKPPGGFIGDPPEECKKVWNYNPNPEKYETIRVVEYVRCQRCFLSDGCLKKMDTDKGSRRRIRFQKNGV